MSTSITKLVLSPGHIERPFREVAARENDDIATIPDTFGRLITGPPLLEGVYPISSRGSSSLTLPSADIFSISDHTFSEQRDELPVQLLPVREIEVKAEMARGFEPKGRDAQRISGTYHSLKFSAVYYAEKAW